MSNSLVTEFSFILPRGLVTVSREVYRDGVMRLATAKDEIAVQKDYRSQDSSAYSALLMFARVITRLGTLTTITPDLLENLFTVDLSYLQEFYNQINQQGHPLISVQCPACQNAFQTELHLTGES